MSAGGGAIAAGAVARSTEHQGAKIALLHGGALVAYLRDDLPTIPNPGQWDLPGGVREAGETALDCALRETREEFGIDVPEAALFHAADYVAAANGPLPERRVAFFAARLDPALARAIVYGDEGQGWAMMPVAEFVARPDAVAELQAAVATLDPQPGRSDPCAP